ncbi:MAG: DNA replication/repair protein RecF [Ruminococcus sp.]|nr:DNA replication/repair protein RecF [Ruminococcus sp.]
MIIKNFNADGYRNLSEVKLDLHPRLNVLCGKNAQGKTNILEAIWILSGQRSFRAAKDKELININGDGFTLSLTFNDQRRDLIIDYSLLKSDIKNKRIKLNGVPLKTPSELFGNLGCVVFTPEDLELSKGSPENRRSFIDTSVSQIKKSYRAVTDKYKRILEQRNLQLKQIASSRADSSMLDIWDPQLAQMGAYMTVLRYNYCKKLQLTASSLYEEISMKNEHLNIKYHSTVFDSLDGRNDYKNDLAIEYLDKLRQNRDEDIKAGFTLKGAHRDDVRCYINDMYAKDYASQGQHRSIALILKLAQAYILTDETKDPPCILLDDVLSELDKARQSFVMKKIKGMQVIITCCDEQLIKSSTTDSKLFYIENGRVKEK